MSGQPFDLEAALRERYVALDPGVAPTPLRRVIERIPHTSPRLERRPQPAWSVYVGLAAAIAILALALSGLRGLPIDSGPGASIAPDATFDPTLAGPGIVDAPSPAGHWLVVAVVVVLSGLAMAVLRGGRRLVPAAVATVALAYGVVAGLLPVEVRTSGWATGLAVTSPDMPPGSSEVLLYELAKPGQPFTFGVFLAPAAGPFPITIEGVVGQDRIAGPRIIAAWLDELAEGGAVGPGRPLEPFIVPEPGQTLWLIGEAGSCALGQTPSSDIGMTGLAAVKLRISYLGWPREVELTEVPQLWEPYEPGCVPAIAP